MLSYHEALRQLKELGLIIEDDGHEAWVYKPCEICRKPLVVGLLGEDFNSPMCMDCGRKHGA